MKELPIRKFTSVVSYLTEAVTITLDGRPIGTYTPHGGAAMDETVKKAIEPDQVKREPRGRLSKGLGDIDGREITDVKLVEVSLVEDTPENRAAGSHPIGDPTATKPEKHYFNEFRPAPKPGKK